jgi:transcriptional regulatory protein LevR
MFIVNETSLCFFEEHLISMNNKQIKCIQFIINSFEFQASNHENKMVVVPFVIHCATFYFLVTRLSMDFNEKNKMGFL